MITATRITQTGPTPRHVRNAMAGMRKTALDAALTHWHWRMRPRHFRTAAYGLYGYTPRSKKYERAKQRQKGHRRPLVYSGHTERATKRKSLRGSSKTRRAAYHAPALNFRPFKGNNKMLREEFLAYTGTEENQLIDRFTDRLLKQMRQITTVTIDRV